MIGGRLLFVTTYRTSAASMEPTLRVGEHVAVVRFRTGIEPDRGDIVAFESPRAAAERCGASGVFAKRIVGLPGEAISMRAGVVSVDGERLPEPYVATDRRGLESGDWSVPPGSYFLMGHNRTQSCDSRVYGSVGDDDLVAEVVLSYWPPGRFAFR